MKNTNKDKSASKIKETHKKKVDGLEVQIGTLVDAVKYAQDIIDTVREPFIVLNHSFHVVTANPAFYRLFHVTKNNTEANLIFTLGNNQWEIPELRKMLNDILPKKKVFNDFEVRHDFPKIGKKTMLLNARRIDHSPLILLAIEDITEKEQLANAKINNEKRFRALIEKSAEAIALVNKEGKVEYASPSTKTIMGFTQQEFQNLPNPLGLVPTDDRNTATKLFEKILNKPGSTELVIYRIKHKNGNHIWIESSMTNLINDPNVAAVVINYRDITMRKYLETQKDDFIGIASHELKTPVTSIKAYTQLLQRQFKSYGNVKASQHLVKMDAQLTKLTSLISDLLDVTKMETGKMLFNKNLFDFDTLINETIDQLQLISEQHKISINGTVHTHIYADRERVGLVITNLLTNAIKYSPNAHKVSVNVSLGNGTIVVGVQDFGIGIPKENLSNIFQRFFRVQGLKGETYPGLGLGLYIAAEIIRRHEGKMWVKSNLGKGSTFYFTLPVSSKQETDTNKPSTELVEE